MHALFELNNPCTCFARIEEGGIISMMKSRLLCVLGVCLWLGLLGTWRFSRAQSAPQQSIPLPTSKLLLAPVPGEPQKTNSFPTTLALSPDGRYLAVLNNGYGTEESGFGESIAVLDTHTGRLSDYPDQRVGRQAHQTYFLGLAFSPDGERLYASVASLTDAAGTKPGDTGNGIAVYKFANGRPTPDRFIRIPVQTLAPGKNSTLTGRVSAGMGVPFPAGLVAFRTASGERLLVADNLSDDASLIDADSGQVLSRFDLSTHPDVPASYPYGVVVTRDGARGYCTLWNASTVAELDLTAGKVVRMIPLLAPASPTAAGSHPTALELSPDEKRLYVALANVDRVAAIDTATGQVAGMLSTSLPGQQYGGSVPNALTVDAAGTRLFVADASTDAIAVFDLSRPLDAGQTAPISQSAMGFIPTEWYPTALAIQGDHLFVATGKGEGTGPNSAVVPPEKTEDSYGLGSKHPYIATLLHGSLAQVSITKAEARLAELTRGAVESNRENAPLEEIHFAAGSHPIRHVIYIIKENRSYDQVFGDLKEANGDPSLVLYGDDITPNQHALARQFGILDNFYVSGEVSGNGHVWSMAAIDSDYTEKIWEIGYRSSERDYDFEGEVGGAVPLDQGIPDVDEPGTGYIWTNVARAGLSHRNYGEFVLTKWCNDFKPAPPPEVRTPAPPGLACSQTFIQKGEPLPPNVGQPHGGPSPWPWKVPVIARDVPTKPELVGHFDPRFADFNLLYPDQLRADEFLSEFAGFVKARAEGAREGELPQFVILRLGNDHTNGTSPGGPRPEASVADNDLAVGRVAEAVSHSAYWDDTAIFILEDDAQDGPDHVDAHRSPALVISKYSPGSAAHPFVDHGFYTTVNMVRTMEDLLGLPPMNNNDALAAPMAPLFSGPAQQPPFQADRKNETSGLIYQVNPPHGPGARESARMDFSHADAIDAAALNAILWRERKGDVPMPPPRHTVIPAGGGE
jgi:DNA-binding beta-propeller fold protein YncE